MGKSSVSLRQRLPLHVETFEDRRLLSAGSLVLQFAPQWLRSEQLLRSFDARLLTLLDSGSPSPVSQERVEENAGRKAQSGKGDGDAVKSATLLNELQERGERHAKKGDGQARSERRASKEDKHERGERHARKEKGQERNERHSKKESGLERSERHAGKGNGQDGSERHTGKERGQEWNALHDEENLGLGLTDGASEDLIDQVFDLADGATEDLIHQTLVGTDRGERPHDEAPRPSPASDTSAADLVATNVPKATSVAPPTAGQLGNALDRATLQPAEEAGPRDRDHATPSDHNAVLPPHEAMDRDGAVSHAGPNWGVRPGAGETPSAGDRVDEHAGAGSSTTLFVAPRNEAPGVEHNVPNRRQTGKAPPLLDVEPVAAARGQESTESRVLVQTLAPTQELTALTTTPRGEVAPAYGHPGASPVSSEAVVAAVSSGGVEEGTTVFVQQVDSLSVGAYVPAVAGLLEAVAPFDRDAVQAAMRQFLQQVENLGGDASSWLAQMNLSPWVVGMALGLTAFDVARRRRQTQRGLALTDDDGTPITWFPGLAGVWNVQDA